MGRRSHTRQSHGHGSVSPRKSELRKSHGEERLVSTIAHPEEAHVVSIREGEGRVVGSHIAGERIIREYENVGEARVVHRENRKSERRSNAVQCMHEEALVHEIIVEKKVEIIKENLIPHEIYIDVPVDVIIERPIQRIIEKEVITEKEVEIPYYRTVDIPVEKIIEVPYERIIENPIETIRKIDCPYETIIEVPYEKIYENITYHDRTEEIDACHMSHLHGANILPEKVIYTHRDIPVEHLVYIDKIIAHEVEYPVEKIIERPIERIIEVPIERLIENPVQIENYVEKIVEVPQEREVINYVEHLVEVPVYIDNIIEKRVPIERIVDKEVHVPVEHFIEVPYYTENIVENVIETIVENYYPVEELNEIQMEQLHEAGVEIAEFVEVPVERVVEKPVPVVRVVHVPVEYIIEKEVERPLESCEEHHLDKYIPVAVDHVIEKVVEHEKVVEMPVLVERPVHIQIETIHEEIQVHEVIIEKPVYVEQIIERKITVIKEVEVIVKIPRTVVVPVIVTIERAVPTHRVIEQEVVYERHSQNPVNGTTHDDVIEIEDEGLAQDIHVNQRIISELRAENGTLGAQWAEHAHHQNDFSNNAKMNQAEGECLNLRSHLSYLTNKLNVVEQDIQRLNTKAVAKSIGTGLGLHKVVMDHPRSEALRQGQRKLISENNHMVENIKLKATGPKVRGNGVRRAGQDSHAVGGSLLQAMGMRPNTTGSFANMQPGYASVTNVGNLGMKSMG